MEFVLFALSLVFGEVNPEYKHVFEVSPAIVEYTETVVAPGRVIVEQISNHGYIEPLAETVTPTTTIPVAHCMIYGPGCWTSEATATPEETPN